jgi:hypothetical protein
MRTYTQEELTNPTQEILTFVYASVEEMANFDNQLQQFLTGSL